MINAAKKYVVSSTLDSVDWNAELIRGDLKTAVQQLKREPGNGLYVGGVQLPLALAEMGLIDEYEFFVHPKLAGHGPTPFAGLSKPVDLKLVGQREFGSGAVALRYEVVGPHMVLVEVDDEVLARLVRAATEGAAPDEVTPPLTPGQTWTPERVAWLRAFHRDRRAGIDGAAAEVTWAVVLEEAVVGSVRLRRTEEPDALELGVWLTRDVRGRGLGRSIMAQVVEQAKALGAVRLQADTTSGNAPALAVLRELGFTVTPGGGSHEVHADLALT